MSHPIASVPAEIFPVAGVRVGAVGAGIRYADRLDLALVEVAAGTECAAVFTRNAFCAAPVSVAREHLGVALPRYLVINAGNANAGTGQGGLEDARAVCRAVAESTGCRPQEVLPFSTGVIGERLPLERVLAGLPGLVSGLGPDGWARAARAIMTTDTGPKVVSRRFDVAGRTVSVTGIAKGAGMIKPDMATMLAFVATDARVERSLLQRCLQDAVEVSFNAITVDGDTSTNDACVLLASGASGVSMGTDSPGWPAFRETIDGVCTELAQAIVRDGEGATKFITIQVEQGRSVAECRQVAYTVAHSPLVKTAFFASDPNWGRILAAVGRAGLDGLRTDPVVIFLDDLCIVRHGGRAEEYTEERGRQVMSREAISVRVQLGRGDAQARVWTTDLSYDYVRINADYRS